MSGRALKILAICTLIGVIAAGWAVQLEWSSWGGQESGKKVFPDLAAKIESVDRLVVLSRHGRMTIKRTPAGWVRSESDDYPVQNKVVQKTLFDLSELRKLEPKTQKKERYGRLALQDPTAKNAESKRVQVFAKDQTPLADIVVGKENLLLQVIREGGLYIREPGEPQTWLAGGDLAVSGEAKDWLSGPIIDIPKGRIAKATVFHPLGDTMVVVQDAKAKRGFSLKGLTSNEKLISDFYPSDIGRALADLEMIDARKYRPGQFPGGAIIRAEFLTIDGLVVRIEMARQDGADWLRIAEVMVSPDRATRAATGIAEEAAAIRKSTRGWIYSVPEFESVHLKKDRAAIVEPKEQGS